MLNWATAALVAVATSTPGPGLPGREQVMAVPAELETQLLEQVIQRGNSKDQRLRLLVEFVSSEHGLALKYDGEATRTVREVAQSGKANCLSFTLLFVTLARRVGLEAHVQEIPQALAWYRQDGVILNAGHVNVRVKAGGPWQTVDVTPNTLLARDRPNAISDERALAYFYNNRGAELMAAGDKIAAGRHLGAAIAVDPANTSAWNNFGVLSLRNGDHRAAEKAYATALKLDARHAAALSNLVTLYQQTGEHAQAVRFLRRLQEAQLADPFHQFLLGMEHEKRGDYANAANYYLRAIRLHRDEHVFHFSLARTYLLAGDVRRSRRALARAYALSDAGTRMLYQAELDSLQYPAKPMDASAPAKIPGPD